MSKYSNGISLDEDDISSSQRYKRCESWNRWNGRREKYLARVRWTLSHLPPGFYVDAAELHAASDVLTLEDCRDLCGCSTHVSLVGIPAQGTA